MLLNKVGASGPAVICLYMFIVFVKSGRLSLCCPDLNYISTSALGR